MKKLSALFWLFASIAANAQTYYLIEEKPGSDGGYALGSTARVRIRNDFNDLADTGERKTLKPISVTFYSMDGSAGDSDEAKSVASTQYSGSTGTVTTRVEGSWDKFNQAQIAPRMRIAHAVHNDLKAVGSTVGRNVWGRGAAAGRMVRSIRIKGLAANDNTTRILTAGVHIEAGLKQLKAGPPPNFDAHYVTYFGDQFVDLNYDENYQGPNGLIGSWIVTAALRDSNGDWIVEDFPHTSVTATVWTTGSTTEYEDNFVLNMPVIGQDPVSWEVNAADTTHPALNEAWFSKVYCQSLAWIAQASGTAQERDDEQFVIMSSHVYGVVAP